MLKHLIAVILASTIVAAISGIVIASSLPVCHARWDAYDLMLWLCVMPSFGIFLGPWSIVLVPLLYGLHRYLFSKPGLGYVNSALLFGCFIKALQLANHFLDIDRSHTWADSLIIWLPQPFLIGALLGLVYAFIIEGLTRHRDQSDIKPPKTRLATLAEHLIAVALAAIIMAVASGLVFGLSSSVCYAGSGSRDLKLWLCLMPGYGLIFSFLSIAVVPVLYWLHRYMFFSPRLGYLTASLFFGLFIKALQLAHDYLDLNINGVSTSMMMMLPHSFLAGILLGLIYAAMINQLTKRPTPPILSKS
ncbi:MAG: hypothetical protein KI792_04590 [Alphaproteobacteria bacterium]|nr:hypothetical protein [Alphaproteobacteria bacterium SS10]